MKNSLPPGKYIGTCVTYLYIYTHVNVHACKHLHLPHTTAPLLSLLLQDPTLTISFTHSFPRSLHLLISLSFLHCLSLAISVTRSLLLSFSPSLPSSASHSLHSFSPSLAHHQREGVSLTYCTLSVCKHDWGAFVQQITWLSWCQWISVFVCVLNVVTRTKCSPHSRHDL